MLSGCFLFEGRCFVLVEMYQICHNGLLCMKQFDLNWTRQDLINLFTSYRHNHRFEDTII